MEHFAGNTSTMPSRVVCVAILVYWLVAALGLITRDLLPELTVGAPPDLRSIAAAGGDVPPARWNILIPDNPKDRDSNRSVGQAVTASHRRPDGHVEMTSKVTFDSTRLLSGLLKGGPRPESGVEEKIEFDSVYDIDPSGNLRSFRAVVRLAGQDEGLWRIDGRLTERGMMEVISRGPLPILNRKVEFDYQERGVVQSQFGPLDRLPGLAVGQRWDERVASPLSGQVETVRAEVARKVFIHWDKSPVNTYEVVHKSKAVEARTWVRADGLVLRQEVVLPMLRLMLERLPDQPPAGSDDEPAAGEGPAR
jgi:hypothetical protein